MKLEILLLLGFIVSGVLYCGGLVLMFLPIKKTLTEQFTKSTQGSTAKTVTKIDTMIKKKATFTTAEQALLLQRQLILSKCLYDPVEYTLKTNRHYMTMPTIYAKFISIDWWRLTEEDMRILLDGLVILRKVRRKQSGRGYNLYKWLA